MSAPIDGFDWDEGNRNKVLAHGVSIAEIENLLEGRVSVFPDLKHSDQEQRFLGIGQADTSRFIFVAFTKRIRHGKTLLRPISARYMHDKEIEHYEKASNPHK
jgi:uncharacterized protein